MENFEDFNQESEQPEVIYDEPLFDHGELYITQGGMYLCMKHHKDPNEFLYRHTHGDWGDLSEEDKAENQLSLEEGFRIFSKYLLPPEDALYVITEWDRCATTILDIWEY